MNKQKKSFPINAADIVITVMIAVVLTVVGNSIVRYGKSARNESTDSALQIELVSVPVKKDYAAEFSVGDAVYFAEKAKKLGVIRSVTISECEAPDDAEDPEAYFDAVSVRVILESEASFDGTSYVIDNEPIIVGNRYSLASRKTYFNAECTLLGVPSEKQSASAALR